MTKKAAAENLGEIFILHFLNISTFSSLVGGILLTFTLVTLLTLPSNATRPIVSLYLLGAVSFLVLIWFIHGLRLRHRLAELVEVAAIRAGLQPLGKTKAGQRD